MSNKHFLGNPCRVCGNNIRYIKGSCCVFCTSARSTRIWAGLSSDEKKKAAKYGKKYRKENKERIVAVQNEYWKRNKERQATIMKRHYEKNKETIALQQRLYRERVGLQMSRQHFYTESLKQREVSNE